jgi:hypothetical protein
MKLIDRYACNSNLVLLVNHSFRTKEQNLHGKIVKQGKSSNHLIGFAVDFNIEYKGKHYNSEHLKKSNHSNLPKPVKIFIDNLRNDRNIRWGGDLLKKTLFMLITQ